MFVPDFPIDDLEPAPYNPRRIDSEQFDKLKESVGALGCIRPVIVNGTKRIIAGHQRTKAMKAVGIDTCPVQMLSGEVKLLDEALFNQTHNAADREQGEGIVKVQLDGLRPEDAGTSYGDGWYEFQPSCFETVEKPLDATRKKELQRLLLAHGAWGGCVAAPDGTVVLGNLYAQACKDMRLPILVKFIDEEMVSAAEHFFGLDYGVYDYTNLPRDTYAQVMAQPYHLRRGKATGGRLTNTSTLYEGFVEPVITKETRILDFGAGQMDYVHFLAKKGYDIRGFEPFYCRGTGTRINKPQVQKHIDRICEELSTQGLYDFIVCDSVINSVDTKQAEHDVLLSLAALCKKGGTVAMCGRRRAHQEKLATKTRAPGDISEVSFLDEYGFTAVLRGETWFYQLFHSDERIPELQEEYFGDPDATVKITPSQHYYFISAKRVIDHPVEEVEESLKREFDMPLPDGTRYGRGDDMVAAYRKALEIEETLGRR